MQQRAPNTGGKWIVLLFFAAGALLIFTELLLDTALGTKEQWLGKLAWIGNLSSYTHLVIVQCSIVIVSINYTH